MYSWRRRVLGIFLLFSCLEYKWGCLFLKLSPTFSPQRSKSEWHMGEEWGFPEALTRVSALQVILRMQCILKSIYAFFFHHVHAHDWRCLVTSGTMFCQDWSKVNDHVHVWGGQLFCNECTLKRFCMIHGHEYDKILLNSIVWKKEKSIDNCCKLSQNIMKVCANPWKSKTWYS